MQKMGQTPHILRGFVRTESYRILSLLLQIRDLADTTDLRRYHWKQRLRDREIFASTSTRGDELRSENPNPPVELSLTISGGDSFLPPCLMELSLAIVVPFA